MPKSQPRIYLSPPHMSGTEQALVAEVFAPNWIAPLGPQVDAFEREFVERVGLAPRRGAELGHGRAAPGAATRGRGPGDEVLVSTLTFSASVWSATRRGLRRLSRRMANRVPGRGRRRPAARASYMTLFTRAKGGSGTPAEDAEAPGRLNRHFAPYDAQLGAEFGLYLAPWA